MPARVTELGASVAGLARGMPPLTECPGYFREAALPNGCGPAGVADDQGMYLLLPALTRLTGLDPLAMLDALGGLYFVPVFALVLGLPILLVADRRWSRSWLVALVALMVAASLANALRSSAGLPLVLGALVVVFMRERSRFGLVSATALLAAYLSIQPFAMDAVRADRDARLGVTWGSTYATSHLTWHSMYINLGFVPNQEGIVPRDESAIFAVPETYATRAYENAIRDRTLSIALADPGLIVRNFAAKTLVLLTIWPWWPLALVLGAFGLRRRAWIVVPAVLVGAAGPLLTAPEPAYVTGWIAAWVAFGALGAWGLLGRRVPAIAVERREAVEVARVARADHIR